MAKSFRDLIKEPLLHFVLLGALIFAYYSFTNSESDSEDSYEIHLDKSDVQRMQTAYKLSWSMLPDSSVLNQLIDEEVKSEIFSREAKRLGLHHNDEIIRRRLVQKYEFLISDVSEGAQPTDEELKAYYDSNLDLYKSDTKYSFYHYYFKEKPNESARQTYELITLNEENIESFLSKLDHHNSFHLQKKQSGKTLREIERSLGKDFSDGIASNTETGWARSPIRSGFGYHLVYIVDYQESMTIPLDDIKGKVMKNWRDNQGVNFKNKLYESLKDKYQVKVEK